MSVIDSNVEVDFHESPEKVTGRELVGLWLFIAGDAIILIALLFTYLYLRGLNTSNLWMPHGVHGVSDVMTWLTVVVVALSAWAVWVGEKTTQRGGRGASAAAMATLLAVVGFALTIISITKIPHSINATSGVRMVSGSYASSLLSIDISNAVHLALLTFLGLCVIVRTRKGLISQATPSHGRLIRIFWVWVLVSVGFAALITTLFVASPK
jgi:heme/copper-type cytochrome/quinol oxidase subunit 3